MSNSPNNRVRLCNGPTIEPSTLKTINTYKDSSDCSYGVILDKLVDHAERTGFFANVILPLQEARGRNVHTGSHA